MESRNYKLYHKCDFDSRKFLEHYLSDKPDKVFEEDFLSFPMENLRKTFAEGRLNGDVLIDLCPGATVHQLYAACDFFKHIIVLKFSERCIMELKRWVDSRTGAFDWCHATKCHVDMEGEKCDNLQEKEKKVKSALQHVVKCDIDKENMMDPIVLPPADCAISFGLMDVISKDQNEYIKNLKKFLTLLKPGGHIIIIGVLDATYYTVGEQKFHLLNYDEDFVKKAVVGEGLVIDRCEVMKRRVVNDLVDHKGIIFIAAHKEK